MRRYLLVAWGALGLLCGVWSVRADDPAAEPAASSPAKDEAPAAEAHQDDATFTGLDKNQDGQLEESEVTDEQRGLFDRLMRRGDTNQDGKLSREEFVSGLKRRREREAQGGPDGLRAGGGPGARLEGLFQHWDADANGQVGLDEVPEERQAMFERMLDQFDDNDDDQLSLEEFRAGARRFAERFRGGAAGAAGGGRLGGRGFGGPPGGGPPGGGPAGGGPGRGGPLLAALDADQDGQVSAAEISAAPEALKKLDKNGDGTLTREELGPPPGGPLAGGPPPEGPAGVPPAPGPGQPGYRLMQGFHHADSNSDGKLTREEMPPRIATHFDKMDVNTDGFVDEEEFRLALGYLAKRMQAGGGGNPRRPGKRPGGAPPPQL